MSDYGDDDLNWDDPDILAELESLESNVTAAAVAAPPPARPAPAPAPIKAQPAPPRASQIPPKPAPARAAVLPPPGGRVVGHSTNSRATTPAASAFPTASQYGNARPPGILRPARPPRPPAQRAAQAPTTTTTTALKQELSKQGAGAQSTLQHAKGEEEEENLPEIRINEDAGPGANGSATMMYRAEPQRGTTVSAPNPPPPRPQPGAGPPPSRPNSRAQTPTLAAPPARPNAAAAIAAPPPPAPAPLVLRPAPAPPAARTTAASTPQPLPAQAVQAVAAGGSGLSAQEREELEMLRREKAKLKEELEATAKKAKEFEQEVQRRAGEIFIIRSRHSKAEIAHQQLLDVEKRDKQQLIEQIKAKEREYKQALTSMQTDKSFRQMEVETSGGRGAASAASRRTYTRHHPSAHGQRPSSQQSQPPRGPSTAPESPTADRRRPPQATRLTRASTEQPAVGRAPPPPAPLFANFQNSFAPAAAPASSKRGESVASEREGSMGPPQMPINGKDKAAKRQAPATPPTPAAKRRRAEGAPDQGSPAKVSPPQANGVNGVRADGPQEEEEPEEDQDAPWSWVWVHEDKDTPGELLAAVFAHITLGAIDTTPAVVPNPHAGPQNAATGRTAATMRASTARSGMPGTASMRMSGRQRTQGRNSLPTPPAAAPKVAKQPTIYALTNLRLPPSTAPALVSRYEDLSRDLFSLLGHRHDARNPLSSTGGAGTASKSSAAASDAAQRVSEVVCRQEPEAGPLAFSLATIFASMLHVLEAATLTGPMTALLKLISHLAFLCPPFAMACCGAEAVSVVPPATNSTQKKANAIVIAPTSLVSLVGHIIARYCRPAAPDPDSLSATGRNALAGSAVVRSRRPRVTRSLGGRRSSATNANGPGAKKGNFEAQRVENLDPAKRIDLNAAALALLEGVAWKTLAVQPATSTALVAHADMDVELATRLAEDAFADLLVTPYAIATLFDPLHSADLLLLGTRFLSMLASRKALFYKIMGVKFYELEDVRTSRLAIFDRIASLLAAKRDDTDSAYNLDLALLSFATVLMMARDDAILLVAGSDTFVSQLLGKIWQDVRVLWEWDGRPVLAGSRERMRLDRRVHRLSRSVKLFYYMSLAPHTHSKLSIIDLLAGSPTLAAQISIDGADGAANATEVSAVTSNQQRRNAYQRQAAHDTLTTSFGTLAFATMGATEGAAVTAPPGGKGVAAVPEQMDDSSMPSWVEPGSKERRTLIELGYMAQEMLEDNSPDELDEIEVCFGGIDDVSEDGDASDDDEDELEIQETHTIEGDQMQLDAA
ncbi:hypothetical protein JCM10908_002539 [Rhodotorula pacifica]|uniref:uncharacterized protein n=1 Tax=Rhodotorula pacifica TaxID=1495444 RepID=UPI00317BBC3B